MIVKKNFMERRANPRVKNSVPVKISHEDGDLVTETGNISRSGVYCRVNKYIAPMIKLQVHLLLPVKKNGRKVTKKILCQGVVVRTESVPGENYYNIAIFFNDISQRDSEAIDEYIAYYLQATAKE